jgi:hypothetical protein
MRGRAAPPDPCLDREYCRALCRLYVEECLRYRARGERYLELSFEEMLEAPTFVAGRLAQFAGCSAPPSRLLEAAALVRGERGPGNRAGIRSSRSSGSESFCPETPRD